MAMRPASARSVTGHSRWPRARWTRLSSPPFSLDLAATLLHSVLQGRCTTSAWTGASGTTILAAERAGRVARMIELDPLYVDTAIRRWQALTGGKARHAASGRCFDDLADEAEAADAA